MQAQFMIAGEQKVNRLTEVLAMKHLPAEATLYVNLITEEMQKEMEETFSKLEEAVYPDEKLAALCEVLDTICDSAVVLMGLANALGLPFGLAYEAVHRSNMNKFVKQEDGTYRILKRADGKIVKPKDWQRPDIMSILKYKLVIGE
jgi:predicted HAD superfamily Cof-like phosphohydrolase